MRFRRLRAFYRWSLQKLFSGWRLSLRILVCFGIGWIALLATSNTPYDTRFTLRGSQKVASNIVIIELSKGDLNWFNTALDRINKNSLWSLKEIVDSSDSFFWNPNIWQEIIQKCLNMGARAVAITLYFSDEITKGTLTYRQNFLFKKNNIFWAAKSDPSERILLPGTVSADAKNTGTLDLRPDPDGKIRHFLNPTMILPHLGGRIAEYLENKKVSQYFSQKNGEPINFQGPSPTFKTISFSDFIQPDYKTSNAVFIFTVKDSPAHLFQTPVGTLTSGELLANITYNFTNKKWITKTPLLISTLYILAILLLAVWIIFEYPQSVALVFLGFISLGLMSLSAALFDLYSIWIPIEAPLLMLIVTYVVISGYRLSESEKMSWESERELHYLSEVEALKDNFLSLISHDLKNPLAKIQGITDRLLHPKEETSLSSDLKKDLLNIRQISEELRQYITSILQITKVEARNIKLSKEVYDINSIVDDVINRLKPLAQNKNIAIETQQEPLFSMELDRTLITEVLINLVENAIKYSNPSSHILITTQEVGNDVKVEVQDRGSGISEEELNKVFDKFYRGKNDNTIKVGGSGLGLYLVKYFIELHGGSVFINSKVGEGTKVGFTLPIDEQTEEKENYAEFESLNS